MSVEDTGVHQYNTHPTTAESHTELRLSLGGKPELRDVLSLGA